MPDLTSSRMKRTTEQSTRSLPRTQRCSICTGKKKFDMPEKKDAWMNENLIDLPANEKGETWEVDLLYYQHCLYIVNRGAVLIPLILSCQGGKKPKLLTRALKSGDAEFRSLSNWSHRIFSHAKVSERVFIYRHIASYGYFDRLQGRFFKYDEQRQRDSITSYTCYMTCLGAGFHDDLVSSEVRNWMVLQNSSQLRLAS